MGTAINATLQKLVLPSLCVVWIFAAATLGPGQEAAAPVKVVVKDGKLLAAEVPIDPAPRIDARYAGGMMMGLSVGGTRITCTPESSIMPMARIDNQELQPGFNLMNGQPSPQQPLPPGPFGKKRLGTQTHWTHNGLHFTQLVELVPSRLTGATATLPQRRLDTVRISCLVENKDTRNHTVEFRTFIDTMIANNDGALFAAPTVPGKILDGMLLQGQTLPEYLQVLERADLDNPGFVASMTLKFGNKLEGPNKVVLANTLVFNGGWDAPAQKANGDSAVFLYWPAKTMKPGEKRNMVWAYGGGVASNPEMEDNVILALGGSFEPGKLFTVMATIDDPVPGQTLTLELPAGLERVEGNERQPVPAPAASGMSAVLWKARVVQLGDYALKVRSSTGVTQVKNISIQAAR
jgi:hypothetical protein